MFWTKKSKKKKAGAKKNSRKIRKEALANAAKAREMIGDETLQRINAIMAKKGNTATERAKSQIASADADRVADEILYMLDDKD